MNELSKRCDVCRQSVVCWPQIFTVIGPLDLCGNCYWKYRGLIQEIADYFNSHGVLPTARRKEEARHA